MKGLERLKSLSKAAAQGLANRFLGFYKQQPRAVQEWLDLQAQYDFDAKTQQLMQAWQKRCPNLSTSDAAMAAFMLEKNTANTEYNMMERVSKTPFSWASLPFFSVAAYGSITRMQVIYDQPTPAQTR